jgi:hypothetical protein
MKGRGILCFKNVFESYVRAYNTSYLRVVRDYGEIHLKTVCLIRRLVH